MISSKDDIKVINAPDYRVLEHFGIPSSQKLIEIDASPVDDVLRFKAKVNDILEIKMEKDCEIL